MGFLRVSIYAFAAAAVAAGMAAGADRASAPVVALPSTTVVHRVSATATGAVARAPAMAAWQRAVGQQTAQLVAAGWRELGPVATAVAARTAELEQEARREFVARKANLAAALIKLARQSSPTTTHVAPALLDSTMADTLKRMSNSWDRAFAERRDRLIAEHFQRAMQGAPPR